MNTPLYDEIKAVLPKNAWSAGIKHAIKQRYEASYLRTKLMFIGKGNAGKTTTIKSLLKKKYSAKICVNVNWQM